MNGSNIVLFHKASVVAARKIPFGTKISAVIDDDESFAHPNYIITEQIPFKKIKEDLFNFDLNEKEEMDERPPTLAINSKSLLVFNVEKIEYTTAISPIDIMRYKQQNPGEHLPVD